MAASVKKSFTFEKAEKASFPAAYQLWSQSLDQRFLVCTARSAPSPANHYPIITVGLSPILVYLRLTKLT
jgi:hypothetical protein